ncbi:T9SS type A sorting domain-containing protein [Lacinutrix sp. WUR7]|uniref:T9SS type A sorting domain-containing protein n=1 Tax=Lacinutrix sp. WUR7 TaxID=2653681 RepID=UPI00193EBA62|nr:T9SS type A sorting domain-containing protein [Lacinutrix sp. WUR7]QRM88965.1 T9SS type A sorting domain-containing protein [Lacinutrix sp. WUR7]
MEKITHYKFACFTWLAILFSLNMLAQKPVEKRSFEIRLEKDEAVQTVIKNNQRVNVETGVPVALYGLNYEVPQGSPESMALYYLEHESKTLGFSKEEIQNLKHHATRTTDAGSVVRFRQHADGYPVNKAEVTISISPENKVVYVMNSYQSIKSFNSTPSVSEDLAYTLAYNYLNVSSDVLFKANRLMVYNNPKMTRLANEVTILTNNPAGEWHVFVDAQTEEIFKVIDLNQYYSDEKHKHNAGCLHASTKISEDRRRVSGTGMIFNPDPLTSNMVAYGGGYVDNNDVASAELNAARMSVTLNDITLTGSTYSLVGPRAEIVDFDTPNTGLFTQNSSVFNFTREEDGFEAVNIYYHIDFLMDYINNTLGCDVMPYQYTGGVQFDPHGWSGQDQSSFSSGTGQLRFGEGCVDDGEDSDVIHHELGHGLHDWVTSGGLSQVNGLSEGCGDYVAQSYNRGVNNANGYWTAADPAYNYVFNWDGHNECWGGRTTAYGATYPGGLVGQIHTDGQIWASCLMTVWDQIGQQEMDKIFYEGLGMTNGASSQDDAANAVYQAAINLSYTNTQLNAIHSGLTACGYSLPALPGPPVAAISADNETICLDTNNMINFMDETVPNATSWAWTFEGGSPATSTEQNPTVTYAADGTYDVALVATNSYGTNSITMNDYISVVSGTACPSCETTSSVASLGLGIVDGTGVFTPGAAVTHVITVPAASDVVIGDVKVQVNISHTFIRDLEITVIHPNGTDSVLLYDQNCVGENDLDITFSDGADAIVCAEPTTGVYNPDNPLSAFSGLNSAGEWTISIRDWYVGDVGTLNNWSIEICSSPTASINENSFNTFSLFPNPNKGVFTINLNSSSNKDIHVEVYDIRGRSVFNNSYVNTTDFNQEINLSNVQSGMYLVKVSDGEKETIKKILIE